MTSAIWKFEPLASEAFSLRMPRGAEILTVQVQHGKPQIWAKVDPTAPVESRRFALFGTGHRIPDERESEHALRYVGTFQVDGGALVFHLFEASPLDIERCVHGQSEFAACFEGACHRESRVAPPTGSVAEEPKR